MTPSVDNTTNGYRMGLFDIETHFEQLLTMLEQADIAIDGLFLNADAGFDSQNLRNLCKKKAYRLTLLSIPVMALLGIGTSISTNNFTIAVLRLSGLLLEWMG